MVRGLEFDLSDSSNSVLIQMLSLYQLAGSEIFVDQEEVIADDSNYCFESQISIKDIIIEITDVDPLIIFLKLSVWPHGSIPKPISNYSDFMESECELVCLITDVTSIEVYTKCDETALDIFQLAHKSRCRNIKFKTESDARHWLII